MEPTQSDHQTETSTHLRLWLGIPLLWSLALLPNYLTAQEVFVHRGPSGTLTFSDTPMLDGGITRQTYSAFTRIPTIANPCSGHTQAQLLDKGAELDSLFTQAASRFNVDPALIKAVARAESCFDHRAVSHAGAEGLMQLMPATARALGVTNSFIAEENVMGGAKYLSQMLARYKNDVQLALAAYNAGPGNVDKYSGVPPFKETQRYIKAVSRFRQEFHALGRQKPTLLVASDHQN